MPIPTPNKGEEKEDFIGRCIAKMKKEDPDMDKDKRKAICYDHWENK